MIHTFELLETRIAPATLLSPHKVSYTDLDGDLVIVTVSKGDLTGHLTFDSAFDTSGPQLLEAIDLTDPHFHRANLTVKVAPHSTGNGTTDVGVINATGVDLGTVSVSGDLEQITAGDGVLKTRSVTSLKLGSFGKQNSDTADPGLLSDFTGSVGKITVAGDFANAHVRVEGDAFGDLGALSIGGSLIGGANPYSAAINVTGNIGHVKIMHDMMGQATKSGQITSGGFIGKVSIDGALTAGTGDDSGTVLSGGRLGFVTVGGDVTGSDVGRAAGAIIATGRLDGALIKGSLTGRGGREGGEIFSGGAMGPITVRGDVSGGAGASSGQIKCSSGLLASVYLGGSLEGGVGDDSGEVSSFGRIGTVVIMHDIVSTTRLTTAGDFDDGEVESVGFESNIVSITVHGSLMGGNILASGKIVKAKIFGSVMGGMADRSGLIGAGPEDTDIATGRIGSLTILHDLVGGSGTETGTLVAYNIGSAHIGGDLTSGTGAQSGSIRALNRIGTITVLGEVTGTADHSVVISAGGPAVPSATTDVVIRGVHLVRDATYLDILAGYDETGAATGGHAQITAVKVGGNWTGSNIVAGATAGTDGFFGTSDDAAIPSSLGVLSRIAQITIGGSILATGDTSDSFGFVAESIGAIKTGGVTLAHLHGPENDHLVPAAAGSDLFINEVGGS